MNKIYICLFSFLFFYSNLFGQTSNEMENAWGDIDYKDNAWVKNNSQPHHITKGLRNRHIAVWASHGRFYDARKQAWRWQRPSMFGTTEDLFTQTIVVPYLIPMLEKAGANVFTPRERDWQCNEVIVDNDDKYKYPYYVEVNNSKTWGTSPINGFSNIQGDLYDGVNPFMGGTSRMIKTTKGKHFSSISYQPNIPQEGEYAVYVSYSTLENSVDDAEYIVYHKGVETKITVNQQMGGGTWVYIGTFSFDRGCNPFNRVVITNHSHHKGVVTSDAIRFGGGMGNINRGGIKSGLPRCVEGARYTAQWSGSPYSVYGGKSGEDDYADDINSRSQMVNWLAGGSVYVPTIEGLKVPLELSLAVHSDAGYAKDFNSLVGSLAIYTTNYNDGRLNSGVSRYASKDLASSVLNNLVKDIQQKYGKWAKRHLWDRNYSETRLPEVPSAIIETMSHQNFPDMLLGQDPNFKFTFARSLYKTLLKYVANQHGEDYVVAPLPPKCFKIEFKDKSKVELSWEATPDHSESTSNATSFNVYMATGTSGFDNGTNIKSNHHIMELEPNVQYNFYITACNNGGESFPTEVLSAYYQPQATETILVVNGFNRLSGPAVINNEDEQGFDLREDIGVSYGKTLGWNGYQQVFSKYNAGTEGPDGLGFSDESLAGKVIMGNTFNYTVEHTEAIATAYKYNIVSSSSEAAFSRKLNLDKYKCIDLILGLEKSTTNSLKYYKTFTPDMQRLLQQYTQKGGSLIVSGAYVASDMKSFSDKQFLENVLKINYSPTDSCTNNSSITGLGLNLNLYNYYNDTHYAAPKTDIIHPTSSAICAMQYADQTSSAVAYKGSDYSCFTMGFPFECIINKEARNKLMRGILNYLLTPKQK